MTNKVNQKEDIEIDRIFLHQIQNFDELIKNIKEASDFTFLYHLRNLLQLN